MEKEIVVPCVAWFVVITFVAILLAGCASVHCDAYGENENNIKQEELQSSLVSLKQ